MSEESAILLGVLILAYLFLTPLVLIILLVRQKKRTRQVEEDVWQMIQRLERVEQGVRAAREQPVAKEEPEKTVVQPTGESYAGGDEETMKVEPLASEATPVVQGLPVPPQVKEVSATPIHAYSSESREAAEEDEAPDPWSSRIREFMERVGMWPPSVGPGRDRETVLMQWWLPRIGGLLALLSALFFGVYISQDTSPFFKCMELLAASLAITGLGRYLERRYRTFGGIVLVTGLLMLYLTSVAAYVLPATRIIENPLAGSLCQAVVLLLICVVGLVRRAPGIVLLAFHLGCFLTVFMAWEGLREGCLIAAGLLFAAGMVLSRNALFRPLVYVIIPGSFLAVLAFPALEFLHPVRVPGDIPVQVFINLVVLGITAMYFTGQLGKGRGSRILLSLGSSLAILSTLWFFRVFSPEQLEWAALVLGCNMLIGSLAGWNLRGCGFLAQLYFIKATFLIGVWVILHYAGDLRWMVLCLQTVVVALATRRSTVHSMELATWAVAAASVLYFVDALQSVAAQGTFVWWMMCLYPAVITLAFSVVHPSADGKLPALNGNYRMWPYAIIPFVACYLWIQVFENTPGRGFDMAMPFVCILFVFAGLSRVRLIAGWLMLLTAGLAFGLANLHFWNEPFSIAVLVALGVASVVAVRGLVEHPGKGSEVIENGVYLLFITSLSLWMLQILNDWQGQGILVFMLGIVILLGGLIPRVRHVGSWSFLPLLVCILTESTTPGAGVLNLVAYGCGLLWLAVPVVLPGVSKGHGWGMRRCVWSLIGAGLFWYYAIRFGDPEATWISGQLVFGVIGIVLLLGAWRWPVHGYLTGSLLFVAVVAARHAIAMLIAHPYAPWKSEALLSGALLYAYALAWFFLSPAPFSFSRERSKRMFLMFSSAMAAILFYANSAVTFRYDALGWMDWYTPILAVTAFAMILLGLYRKDSVFRRLGLLALAIPLVRLFMVDVQDVLHRIIAFAAAAVLLAFLGYVYNRIASRTESKITEDA